MINSILTHKILQLFLPSVLAFSLAISIYFQTEPSNNLKPQFMSSKDTIPDNSFASSTIALSNILVILKDSLDDYADIIDQGSGKPWLQKNFQHPISIRLMIEDNQLYLIYACWRWEEMVTNTKTYQYLIPIASLKNGVNTGFEYSMKKKQLSFTYNGIVYINNTLIKKEEINIKITTKLSPVMFQQIANDFHNIGL